MLPNTLTAIEEKAFWYSGITAIDIPAGVRKIGRQAFSFCKELVSVNLPAGEVTIERYAFLGCAQLSTLNLPTGWLEYGVFKDCPKLNQDIRSVLVEQFGERVFGE